VRNKYKVKSVEIHFKTVFKLQKQKNMLDKKVEKKLNDQVKAEGQSSQLYLSMASWADAKGLNGTAQFLYRHSDEEREHMLKLVKFINERGGKAVIPSFVKPIGDFKSIKNCFESLLKHELHVTALINDIVDTCLKAKDYPTYNFMQWYVSEQIEEEALARDVLDKLEMIGNDKAGLYLFDRDLENLMPEEDEAAK